MSSFIALMTSLCSTTESRAQPLCARVTSCLIAVRKPWGLKKPVIQNTLGRPLKIHVENWPFLSRNSVNQNPRVEDSHEICVKIEKMWPTKKHSYICLCQLPKQACQNKLKPSLLYLELLIFPSCYALQYVASVSLYEEDLNHILSFTMPLMAKTTTVAFSQVVTNTPCKKTLLFSKERESWHHTCYPKHHAGSVTMGTNN